jgi:hypothetical protein
MLSSSLMAQSHPENARDAIRELKEGYLVVRFPGFKNKIDTLNALIARSEEGATKKRLTSLLNEAVEERDRTLNEYKTAFEKYYRFSKSAYYMDYESKDLKKAHYHSMNDENISYESLHEHPVYYLLFERTGDGKLDALVIYDGSMKKVPGPFPNNFSRSGFNALFISATEKSLPDWRVKKMNKKLFKFWSQVN